MAETKEPLYLFLMIGFPGSGKSYFARQMAEAMGVVRLNGDGARYFMYTDDATRHNPSNNPQVFGALNYAMIEILRAGKSVVIDASHNRYKDRDEKPALVAPFGAKVVLVWVQTPLEEAIQREASRDLTPEQIRVPRDAYEFLVNSLQPPRAGEAHIIIDGTGTFVKQLDSFKKQLRQLG